MSNVKCQETCRKINQLLSAAKCSPHLVNYLCRVWSAITEHSRTKHGVGAHLSLTYLCSYLRYHRCIGTVRLPYIEAAKFNWAVSCRESSLRRTNIDYSSKLGKPLVETRSDQRLVHQSYYFFDWSYFVNSYFSQQIFYQITRWH